MKKYVLLLVLSITLITLYAQDKSIAINLNPLLKQPEALDSKEVRKISSSTAFLILDLNRTDSLKMTEDKLIEKYNLIKKDKIIYANSFIKLEDVSQIAKLSEIGVLIGSVKGSFITGLIPVDMIDLLSKDTYVKYIQIGEKVNQTMDNARIAANVNQVHSGTLLPQSYYGDGVVVGIIDEGFDYTHPNFYNSTGSSGYRIKRVWEQDATIGVPPIGYTYGRELSTQAAILAAQRDEINESHGTHVAGIAGGAGGGASTSYTGVAPKSDLVFVSTDMTDVGVLEGIEYIQNYAASVGKPSVVNLSLGNHVGPHDGTSLFDQLCDSFLVGKGRVLVGSAGNEGNDNLYLEKTFTAIDTTLYSFVSFPNSSLGSNGETWIDTWGEVGDNFYIGVHIYNTSTNAFEDATPFLYNGAFTGTYSHTLYDNDFLSPDACVVHISTGIDPLNNKPRASIYIDHTAQDDNYRFAFLEIKAFSTSTKMWSNKSIFSNNGYAYPAQSGSSNSTIGELGGTGKNMISVGAFTTKNSWTSFSSNPQSAPFFTALGALAPFSSKGPTADGRIKPDITAPGNVLASSVSRFDANYSSTSPKTVSGVTNGTNTWWYGMMQGTSMSAPFVTGVIALWLEMYPELTPDQIKSLMQTSAITDSHTGTIPVGGSNLWGRGKINAWVDIPSIVPARPIVLPNSTILCLGQSITLMAPTGYSSYLWSNGATSRTISVNSSGAYKVKVTNASGYSSPWSDSATVNVYSPPPIPFISVSGSVISSNAPFGNQWYYNGVAIPGATGQTYSATQSGRYFSIVTNSNNCYSQSNNINVSIVGLNEENQKLKHFVYPNPNNGEFTIEINDENRLNRIEILNSIGQTIWESNYSKNVYGIDGIPSGVYFVTFIYDDFIKTSKVVVQ